MNTTPTKAELRALARENRIATLKLDTAEKELALKAMGLEVPKTAMEGYYDPDNIVDIRDYLSEGPMALPGAVPTTRVDRDQGRNWPFFRTESELAIIRGAARLIAGSHPVGVGVLNALTNYVMGTGFKYSIRPKKRVGAADPIVNKICDVAQHVIDTFQELNSWTGDLDRELFQRRRVDGEYFLTLTYLGDGQTRVRAIEPDQVTEPGGRREIETSGWLHGHGGQPFKGEEFASDWSFGIHADDHDPQNVHGIYVQWTDRDNDWDYFPSGSEPLFPPQGSNTWCQHAKTNVVRSVKRGMSDFFCVSQGLELSRKVLRNVGSGAAIQAAIAWIKEVVPGTTQTQVNNATMSAADYEYRRSGQTGNTTYVKQYDPGTVLTPAPGTKYTPGPLGSQTQPNYIQVADAILRSFVAVRWNMPEHIVTGSAENNNFASTLVAESPFVKNCQAAQHSEVQQHKAILWRVLYFAWLDGVFGDQHALPWATLRAVLELLIVPPQIETRDPVQETQVRQILHQAGAMSLTTWQQEEELDPDQERANIAHEQMLDQQLQQAAQQPQQPPRAPQQPRQPVDDQTDDELDGPTDDELADEEFAQGPQDDEDEF